MAKSTLESIGMHAQCVNDTEHAVRCLEAYHSKGKDPIVLLDWNIQGKDGIDAAKNLRSRFGGDITMLLLSDGDWDELEEPALHAGINGFAAKPLFRSTLFYSLRPFAEEKRPALEDVQEEEADEVDFTGKRVLFAEDNELNWEIADAMLSELGMVLDHVENGKICLEKFKQSQNGWYDLILMDLRMPEMTGYEAAAAIRSLARDDAERIPIIAVSADAFEDDIKKCFDCGMNAHTAKPYNIVELMRLMSEQLQKVHRVK